MQNVLEATPGAAPEAEASGDDALPPRSTERRDVRLLMALIALGSALWPTAIIMLVLTLWR